MTRTARRRWTRELPSEIDGVAIGECFVYDEEGPIGSASCAALAQVMRPRT